MVCQVGFNNVKITETLWNQKQFYYFKIEGQTSKLAFLNFPEMEWSLIDLLFITYCKSLFIVYYVISFCAKTER